VTNKGLDSGASVLGVVHRAYSSSLLFLFLKLTLVQPCTAFKPLSLCVYSGLSLRVIRLNSYSGRFFCYKAKCLCLLWLKIWQGIQQKPHGVMTSVDPSPAG